MKSIRERYPGPWIIEEARESMIVRTRCGRQVAQIFAEDMETRRHLLGHMTWAEARAIARAIAGLADSPLDRPD